MKLCRNDIVFGEDEGNTKTHRVLFVKESDGEILALFPDRRQSPNEIMGYQFIGQYNTCHEDLCFDNELADPMEYTDLLDELATIYDHMELDVLNKNYT